MTGEEALRIIYGGLLQLREGIQMAKGDPKKKPVKNPRRPGSGGKKAGAGGQGGGGGGPASEPLRWEFDLPAEEADKSWKGQAIWGKIDRNAVYVESPNLGSLGRVPPPYEAQILNALQERSGSLAGEILEVKGPRLIRGELVLI